MKLSKKYLASLGFIAVAVVTILVVAFLFHGDSSAADPTGASYIATSGLETLDDVAALANKAYLGSNYVWIMICGFLVFFFQCGFAMVETGFCRAKNAAHTMTMNFMVFLVGAIGYFLFGFAIQMGGSGGVAGLGSGGSALNALVSIPGLGGVLGYKGFALLGTYDAGIYALFFFQMVFMD
ncbi:MAG TPA: ammonium transporter, partial [Erysipelotrichaceae bacterium]|nr:ammonium transporter [Erysipelotrichaceae bacterium]